MIRLLTKKDTGAPTAAARSLAQTYREILIDEYQDSNAVQERIFQAVSREGKNLFLVGDVKQSIYRFRLADPTIFLQKYAAYPMRGTQAPGEPRKLLLSKNFRSRAEILEAANDVFSARHEKRGRASWTTRRTKRSSPARSFPDSPGARKVELHCLDLTRRGRRKPATRPARRPSSSPRASRELLRGGTFVTENGALRPAQRV